MAERYFAYVLRSRVTGRWNIGSTSDIDDRLIRHNGGESKATRHGIPWELIQQEHFATRSQAIQREKDFKTGKGREELRNRFAAGLD